MAKKQASETVELPSPEELDALEETADQLDEQAEASLPSGDELEALKAQAHLDLTPDERAALAVQLEREHQELKKQRKKLKKERKKLKKERKKKDAGTLGTSRGIETMFRTSYRQHVDLSSLADNKANIMISINGIIISVLIGTISSKIDSNVWLIIPTSALLVGCLISLVFAVFAARPRVSSEPVHLEDVRKDKTNILFFGNFVNMQKDDYLVGMTELATNTDRLYRNMMLDIYGLGGVLQRKFTFLRISYTVFMIGLALGVALFIGVYILIALSEGVSL